ncbi:Uncharacterized protein TCM_044399 [Theobroma cacao]|uniref:Uncharacterized protein n=1 Tax=Theobroma cacao TaxID=3641 RepID=A0A061FX03_THECC|nr:Uncharacterized protein TCM_044399 [Theobroma cacao]
MRDKFEKVEANIEKLGSKKDELRGEQENKGEKKNKNLGGEIQGKIGENSRKQVTKGGEQITLVKVPKLCLKTGIRSTSTPRTAQDSCLIVD